MKRLNQGISCIIGIITLCASTFSPAADHTTYSLQCHDFYNGDFGVTISQGRGNELIGNATFQASAAELPATLITTAGQRYQLSLSGRALCDQRDELIRCYILRPEAGNMELSVADTSGNQPHLQSYSLQAAQIEIKRSQVVDGSYYVLTTRFLTPFSPEITNEIRTENCEFNQ